MDLFNVIVTRIQRFTLTKYATLPPETTVYYVDVR